MKIHLKRINNKVAFNATNDAGITTNIDGSDAVGGGGLGMRPMELLASSLASCASIDILLILKKMRVDLQKYEVEIEAKRKNETPSSFESIHLKFIIDKSDPKEQVEKAVELSITKYCSVSASLSKEINITFEIIIE